MYTSDITVDQVIDALATFIEPFVDGATIVRGQENRVPQPESPCVILTELNQSDLSVPRVTFDGINEIASIIGPKQIDVQIDFYGVNSGEQCNVVKIAFRSYWGFDHFPANIKPLFAEDARQMPITTGEEQYEKRWMLTVHIQYNPTVEVPQQFADELSVTGFNQVDGVDYA